MAKQAIATIVIGDAYKKNFDAVFLPSWQNYAEQHGLELVIFERLLDTSETAQHRNIAWQKLLIASQEETRGFDDVCWIDADVMINPMAPNIFAMCPPQPGKVGMVEYPNHAYSINKYAAGGFKHPPTSGTNTGVFVANVATCREILEYIYNNYAEDGIGDYENTAMSYHLYRFDQAYGIDTKFNHNFPLQLFLRYAFMLDDKYRNDEDMATYVVDKIFQDAYFLHFIGIGRYREFIKYVGRQSSYEGLRFL
jgi:hypothetical protein